MAVIVTVDDLTTSDNTPIITGTCDIDASDITLTINTTDVFTTTSLSGVWSAPTDPLEIANKVIVATSADASVNDYPEGPQLMRMADGNILNVFRKGAEHADNGGRLLGMISTDLGVTWGSEFIVYDSPTGFDTRNQAGGVDPVSGRIIIFYSIYNAPTRVDVGYITSTDNGVTWSAGTSLATPLTTTQIVPFGPMVTTDNGLMQVFYFHTIAYALFSVDNGATWGSLVVIWTGFSPTNAIGEPSVVAVDTTRLVVMIRDNVTKTGYRYSKSSDGGLTWAAPSSAIAWTVTTIESAAPIFGRVLDNDVYISWGGRREVASILTNRLNKEAFWAAPEEAWLSTSDNINTIYTSTILGNAAPNINFGYTTNLPLTDHSYTFLVAWYDEDASLATNETNIWFATGPRL